MQFTLALIAALAPLLASSQRIESPHGCYSESTEFAGADGDIKISDINTLTGLDAYKAKLSKIVFCRQTGTGLIQGIATIWGHWDDKTRTWSNEKRLNTIGRMSGLVEFDNNKALSAAGLPALQPGQAQAMQRLWFQDASIDQWENFELVDGLKQLSDPNYLKVRQDLFKSVDFDNDDMLDMDEARFFFREVRKMDRSLMPEFLPNYELPYVDTHIYAAQTMSTPYDKVRFDDYLKVEKIMMAWYKAGKLQATGTINPYKQDDKSTITDVALGTYFRSSCDMQELNGDDHITMMQLDGDLLGIRSVSFQTAKVPLTELKGDGKGEVFGQTTTMIPLAVDGKDFAGFWGFLTEEGYLGGLGIIQRDSVCTQVFLNELGPSGYSWTAKRPENFKVPSNYPEEFKARVHALNGQRAVTNSTDTTNLILTPAVETAPQVVRKETIEYTDESGMIAGAIIVWVLAAIFFIVALVTTLKNRGGGSMIDARH